MTTRIGPMFAKELEAVGLLQLPFSWSGDGEIFFTPAITAEQRAAIEAVYQAHDPTAIGVPREEALKSEIQNAKTLEDLKAILLSMVG